MVKRSKIIFQPQKTLENSNIVNRKLTIIEYPKNFYKPSKTIRQDGKVFQISGADKNSTIPLYSETGKK